MITILDKATGKLLYATIVEDMEITENEIIVSEILVDNFDNPYYNFETKEFYNKVEL